jgi:hypothetical protein
LKRFNVNRCGLFLSERTAEVPRDATDGLQPTEISTF